MEKTNILYLATSFFATGGVERYARYQVKALGEIPGVKKVYSFSVLPPGPDDVFGGDFKTDYVAGGTGPIQKLMFLFRAVVFAKKNKINLVVSNHVSLSPVALLIKKLLGIPYFLNVYGLEIWSGMRRRERAGLLGADALVGDCNFILNYVREYFPVDPNKLFLLYDCVDMDRFSPKNVPAEIYAKYKIPKDKKIIGTIGRLVYDKGQETVIRLMKFLPVDIIQLVVGGGPKLEEWEKLVKEEGVADRVIFTGRVPDEDLLYMYNVLDLSVYLSEFKKNEGGGLPLTLIESSSCGKAIIASNEDGAAEAVKDGANGYLVSPRDAETIVKKIKQALEHPETLRLMGEKGREYVREYFSYPVFRQRQTEILAKLPRKS